VTYEVVEVCAGAGGQALGLEHAGFEHALAVEIDRHAAATLRANRPDWKVAQGDVADERVWRPDDYAGVALLAGGVPCPPFSVAGKQLGTSDERDLFAWAVELCARIQPRAMLLENVRGLSMPRFAGYRQAVLDRLGEAGFIAEWRLLQASDFGVPQLRPRFVLVALRPEDAPHFRWPEPEPLRRTVGSTLVDLMGSRGWPHGDAWAQAVDSVQAIAPTVVGGSKKHGGADLGPTRARAAWRRMHVDGAGLADSAPEPDAPHFLARPPRLTVEMVARLQGWNPSWGWTFEGGKTAQYRQVGNAFPPPLARAVGRAIAEALDHRDSGVGDAFDARNLIHDEVYRVLRSSEGFVHLDDLARRLPEQYGRVELERRISNLRRDFVVDTLQTKVGTAYRLGAFRAFTGQTDHARHIAFAQPSSRGRIS
jgi:DNA (cytosine-5)-methyltransferase 1